jgi:hypothetical protein
MNRQLALIAGLVLAVVFAAACAAMNIGSFVQRGFDMSLVRTFEWAPAEHLQTGDPRLDNNQFFQRYVKAAVERELAARGLERADPGMADVVVHYHASVTQRVDTAGADEKYGACEDCRPSVFDAGTLTLDLVDAGTNRLVWRGWAERSIQGVLEDQQWMERDVDRAVASILAGLPAPLTVAIQ